MSNLVLVIDDSAMIRAQVKRALTAAGFPVREAVDGQDAWEKLSPEIGLMVCDVSMPRMSGLELLERMQESPGPKPPVLMLTTEAQPDLIRRARQLGAQAWLVKPFQPDLLVAAVMKMMATAQ